MADVFGSHTIEVSEPDEAQVLCEFCQGTYSVQLEVVCGACERSLCPLCATRSQRIYHCPECIPTGRFTSHEHD
jgi:hypothetical protein